MKPDLIILPGWSGNKLMWQHQVQTLSDICNPKVIVVYDQNTLEKMADAILKQAPDKFILVGHSLGGWLAQYIAIKVPTRVIKLILISTWCGRSDSSLDLLCQKNIRQIQTGKVTKLLNELRPMNVYSNRQSDKKFMEQIKDSQNQFPPTGMIAQLEVVLNGGDLENLLEQIKCPTLVIHGRYDAFFSLEDLQLLATKIPNAYLTIIEECGHLPSIERPEAVSSLIRLWVQLK